MVAEKICHKAANWFKGCWPLNRDFPKMFSDFCRNLYWLSKFAIKNFVKGQKVKFMAFYWPFWPLKVKCWKIIFKIKSFRETKPKLKAWQDRVHYIIFQNLTFKGQKGHKKAMNLTFWPLTKFFIAKFNS